jgi:hypothetical protein
MNRFAILKVKIFSKISILYHKIMELIKLPNFHHFPQLKLESIKRIISIIYGNKFLLISSISVIAVFALIVTTIYRAYILYYERPVQKETKHLALNFTPSVAPSPTLESPSPSIDPSSADTSVLGTSSDSNSNVAGYSGTLDTPTPYPTPLTTSIPDSTITITDSTTSDTSSVSNNTNSDPNCNSASGVANSWYSDIYPASPASTITGSVTLSVTLRDCNKNTASVSDKLSISLSSGDSNAQINGNNLPYSITTQNGTASFNLSSQIAGTVTLAIQDISGNFSITDPNNKPESVIFTSSSTQIPTPSQTVSQAPTQSPNTTPAPSQSATSTVTPNPT